MAKVILFSRRGALLRGLCQGVLSEAIDIEISTDVTTVVATPAEPEPGLYVIDAASGPGPLAGTVELVKSHHPEWRVLVIVRPEQRSIAAEAIEQGADAYILDPFPLEEFATVTKRLLGEVTASQQRAAAHRMEVLTIFLRGLAHEILNPLTTISGILQLFMHPGPEEEGAEERNRKYTIMAEGVDRIRRILHELEYFTRVRRPQRDLVDPGELVAEAVGRAARKLGEERFDWRPPGPQPRILADREQMVFALVNLLHHVARTSDDSGAVGLDLSSGPEETVVLRIHGRGQPQWPADLDRVFVPFYSRNRHDFGEGLSLSAVYGIVRGHHGSIQVEPLEQDTFQFIVRLPTGEAEVRSDHD